VVSEALDRRLMWVVSLAHNISESTAPGHNRTVPSALPDARRLPSGLNTTLVTAFAWPVRGRRSAGGFRRSTAARVGRCYP
jgi:hypothetical protein